MSIESIDLKPGDLVLVRTKGLGVVTSVPTNKKFSEPIVKVFVDGSEWSLTVTSVKKLEVDDES